MTAVTTPEPAIAAPSSPPLRETVRVPGWVSRVPNWLWIGVGLLALMALSAYLRSRYLSGQYWMDEAITTGISVHPLTSIPGVLRYDGNPPLYYMALHIWMQMFGDSVSATHSLSLVFGLLTIPAGGWAGWKLFGAAAPGIMAAILFAFNAWLTAYAQETRMYELMALLGTVATIAYVLGFVHRRRGWLFLFGAMLTAMLYTHSWGTFFFAGTAIALIPALVASDDRKRFLIDVVLTYGIAGILWLPWVPTFLFQVAHTAAPWDTAPRLGAPIQISRDLLGGDRITIIIVFTAIIGLGSLFTKRYRRTVEATTLWTLILVPICVLGLGWIASQVNPAWASRYFAPVLGSLLLLIAWGCSRARVLGFVAIALSCWYMHDPASFTPQNKSDFRNIAAQVSSQLHPGDLVAVGQPEQTPLAWYYLPGGLEFTNTSNHGRILKDPRYMNWTDSLKQLKHTDPTTSVDHLVADMHAGQQLLFLRPLTEGAGNWTAPWTKYVRRRAAQWSQALTNEVSRHVLVPESYAPHSYKGACCVADSAELYRKAS